MDIFKNLTEIVGSAKKTLSDKSKKTAAIVRLRTNIKNEEKVCERAYIALGKYYYHNLRSTDDLVTEPYCAQLDEAREKIEKYAEKLEALLGENEAKQEKKEELKEEVKTTEFVYDEELSFSPYRYVEDEENGINYVPNDQIVDESVEQHNKKVAPDFESQDEENLSFE